MSSSAIEAWAQRHGLDSSPSGEVRELAPALVRGRRGSISPLAQGRFGEGLEGLVCHHVFADGVNRRESTIVLTEIREGAAFAPALVCRDRRGLGGRAPAQLPAEQWRGTQLESGAFNDRYRLLTLKGQDPLYVRELFSPGLIAWLAHDVPDGFSFELNERHLVVALPGHAETGEELERLGGLAAEISRRIRSEALEEGEGTALFDESEKLREIEAALGKARFEHPPASVEEAMSGYRSAAARRPTVLLTGLIWAAVAMAVAAAAVTIFSNPFFGLLAGLMAAPAGFGLGRLLAASRYRWGSVSVSRLGLEAFVVGYAQSHALERRDRWRFHSRHRDLALPGFAGFVLAGPIREAEIDGLFVILGDAAELRSRGMEIAYTVERPMAALALVADLGRLIEGAEANALDLPEGYHLESSESTIALWKPFPGNLLFTAADLDRFRATAGDLVARLAQRS